MDSQRIEPGPGQESVWDYPRPPALQRTVDSVVVRSGDRVIAQSNSPFRVLETSHPPVFYLNPDDVDLSTLVRADQSSFCEWKGEASYYSLVLPHRSVVNIGWFYEKPSAAFVELTNFVAFYPSKVECSVNGEPVAAQEGDFYGGWITHKIVGPFKGGAGTWGW